MKKVAKVTAIIMIVLGAVVIIAAILIGISGAVGLQGTAMIARMGAPLMMTGASVFLGVVLFIQGLVLVAFGQALYLLADMAGSLSGLFKD